MKTEINTSVDSLLSTSRAPLAASRSPLAAEIAQIQDGSDLKVFDLSSRPIKRMLIESFLTRRLPDDPNAIITDTNEANKQILESISNRADRVILEPGKLTFQEASGRSYAAIYLSHDATVEDVTLFSSNGGESSMGIESSSPTAIAILRRTLSSIKSFGIEVPIPSEAEIKYLNPDDRTKIM